MEGALDGGVVQDDDFLPVADFPLTERAPENTRIQRLREVSFTLHTFVHVIYLIKI